MMARKDNFKFTLRGGMKMPAFGLGTYAPKQSDDEVFDAVHAAVKMGYRHIDCGAIYRNERAVGSAIKKLIIEGTIERSDLFVCSKLWNTCHHPDLVRMSLMKTLEDLEMEYLDLYLIHWPMGYQESEEFLPKDGQNQLLFSDVDFVDTWRALEDCVDEGLVRNIGMSNFNAKQLKAILDIARIKPQNNQALKRSDCLSRWLTQIEVHLHLSNSKLIDYCKENNIIVTAYSPLGAPGIKSEPSPTCLEEPVLLEIAKAKRKTPAQVTLRFLLQRGLCVVPKSVTISRVQENFQIFDFDLSSEEMEKLLALNKNIRLNKEEISTGRKPWHGMHLSMHALLFKPSFYSKDFNQISEDLFSLPEHNMLKELTGGYSNYMVTYYTDVLSMDDAVIVRVNGEDENPVFNNSSEVENIMYLHEAGLGPPLFAYFRNGMAYGYVKGVTLDTSMLKDKHIQRLIAREMLAFHKVDIKYRARRPVIWNLFHKFLDLTPTVYKDSEKNKQFQKFIPPKEELRKELDFLKECLDRLESPVVFCHNDLRPSNIIYDKEKDKVTFIDVELAMYNNEHFDIAYHFSEHSGIECMDFEKLPDRDYQLSWLQFYLEEKFEQNGRLRSDVKDLDVEQCYVKVNKFSLAPKLGFAMWGLAMAERSKLDFDFLGYSRKNIEAYFSMRDKLLTMQVPDQ